MTEFEKEFIRCFEELNETIADSLQEVASEISGRSPDKGTNGFDGERAFVISTEWLHQLADLKIFIRDLTLDIVDRVKNES